MSNARIDARCAVARAARCYGNDSPEVLAARQKYQAVKLAETVTAAIPLLSREQIEDIAALLTP